MNGKGTAYYENGEVRYTGGWVNDEYSGEGKEYSKDGELLREGTFMNGEFIP